MEGGVRDESWPEGNGLNMPTIAMGSGVPCRGVLVPENSASELLGLLESSRTRRPGDILKRVDRVQGGEKMVWDYVEGSP